MLYANTDKWNSKVSKEDLRKDLEYLQRIVCMIYRWIADIFQMFGSCL